MNGPCESCHLRPSSHVLRFDPDAEPPFLVCEPCAQVAEGYYGVSEPLDIDGQYLLPLGEL